MSVTTTTIDTESGIGSATIRVSAAPQRVYAVITDLARMGDWSPECVGIEGPDGQPVDAVAKGSTFVGRNARDDNEWTTECRVLAAEPGRLFSFFAGDDDTGTTWSYLLEPTDGGTQVTESFDSLRLRHPEWAKMLAGRAEQLVGDMGATLAAIKTAVEREG
jgi:uncharacterized protein YndB with AHSA1/START domain